MSKHLSLLSRGHCIKWRTARRHNIQDHPFPTFREKNERIYGQLPGLRKKIDRQLIELKWMQRVGLIPWKELRPLNRLKPHVECSKNSHRSHSNLQTTIDNVVFVVELELNLCWFLDFENKNACWNVVA